MMNDVERLAAITDPEIRQQAKYEQIIELMQGETANFSAGVYVSLLASFAIAVLDTGLDPLATISKISQHARSQCRKLLSEQGISTTKPLDG